MGTLDYKLSGERLIEAMQREGRIIDGQVANQIKMLTEQRDNFMKQYAQEQETARQAAAQGDRSENAELQIANDNMSRLFINIQSLDATIDAHNKLRASSQGTSTGSQFCGIGSLVCIVDKSHEDACWAIKLYPAGLGNAKIGAISVGTPLGRALLNHYKGETVTVKAPGGVIRYEIKEVL